MNFKTNMFISLLKTTLSNKHIFIVAYHNIVRSGEETFLYDQNNISGDQNSLERELVFYKNHFDVINYSDFNSSNEGRKDKPKLIITFDDGYASFYDLAYPLFKKHGLSATVFLSTDYVDSNYTFWWDEVSWICTTLSPKVFFSSCFSKYFFPDSKLEYSLNNGVDAFKFAILKYLKNFSTKDVYRFIRFIRSRYPDLYRNFPESSQQAKIMTWEQIAELSEQGFEFGSHTLSHCLLDMCSLDQIKKELIDSKNIIAEKLQKEVPTFCYPTGRGAQKRVQDMLQRVGYKYACLMEPGVNSQRTNPFLHKRISISQSMSLDDIAKAMIWPQSHHTKSAIKAKVQKGFAIVKKINLLRSLYPKVGFKKAKPIKHVFVALCDHFEPYWDYATHYQAYHRVKKWQQSIPSIFTHFKDADGRTPVYSFFYPVEEYKPGLMSMLEPLQENGYGEVEIHLHHDGDTSETLRQKLADFRDTLRNRHGMLATDTVNNSIAYGFIHGNWCLDNSRSDGRWCGVNNEIDVLQQTGCYADFTMPSAPSECQTTIINSLYYAVDDPDKPRSHYTGEPVRDSKKQEGLLMIQGPLSVRNNGTGIKIENSEITGNNYVTKNRINEWFRCGISVVDRPDWIFIKLHTHGTQEPIMERLFEKNNLNYLFTELQKKAAEENAQLHYVSARQMANVIHAIEDGVETWNKDLLDYRYRLLK